VTTREYRSAVVTTRLYHTANPALSTTPFLSQDVVHRSSPAFGAIVHLRSNSTATPGTVNSKRIVGVRTSVGMSAFNAANDEHYA
jgi:hypothetical protein